MRKTLAGNSGLGHKDRRTFKPSRPQIRKGLIGLAQGIARGFGDDCDLGCQFQKIEHILTGEVSH